jgi:hypothetical protein
MPAATRNFSDKLACVIDAFARPILLKVASFFTVRHQGRGCLRHLPKNALYRIAAVLPALTICVVMAVPESTKAGSIDLSRQQVGSPPRDFEFWRAGQIDSGHWTVVREAAGDSGVSIQQAGADRAARPTLALYTPLSATKDRVRMRFKLTEGSMPSTGIAVRVTSPDDYHLVRVSAFEQSLSLLHVVRGTSQEIAGVDADVAQNHWQALEVVANGDGFTISLDEQWMLTAFDYGKVVGGRFGIWSERDDVTRFDQIEISPLVSGMQGRFGG